MVTTSTTKRRKKHSFLKRNSLSVVFALLFILSLVGQFFTGYREHNKDLKQEGQPPITAIEYIRSGHFMQATFENWESEFLQMALFVVLTVFLYQKGSSESKSLDEAEEVDRKPRNRKDAPWPVRVGGWVLELYKHSLTISLFILFILSFIMHFYGSLKEYNKEQTFRHLPLDSAGSYLTHSRFWFESFQNWQSEFLSVLAIIVLSIYLRQQGSPQSKPVDASNEETGEKG